MGTPVSLDEVLELAQELSTVDKVRLIERVSPQIEAEISESGWRHRRSAWGSAATSAGRRRPRRSTRRDGRCWRPSKIRRLAGLRRQREKRSHTRRTLLVTCSTSSPVSPAKIGRLISRCHTSLAAGQWSGRQPSSA